MGLHRPAASPPAPAASATARRLVTAAVVALLAAAGQPPMAEATTDVTPTTGTATTEAAGHAGPTAGADTSTRTTHDSLPSVEGGTRPGPDVLYADPPPAPQLANHDPRFRAEPLLVSGTEAYVDGEYLYQDFIYDDHGANTTNPLVGSPADAALEHAGDLTYPTDRERHADNAADLVELRIAPGEDEVAYRFTLNTLLAADVPMVALAFDTDRDAATGTATLPRDPGAPFPGTDEVVTTWGTGAEHTAVDADGEVAATTELEVTADLAAAQVTVTVPREVSDPRGTWRATLAVGLHDPDTGGWLRPGPVADTVTPGGAGPLNPEPSGIFNLGFRFDEPITGAPAPPDTAQAQALADDAPTRFAHDLDFDRLAAGEDLSTVPETGTMVRLFPSRLDLDAGRDLSSFPALLGQLQPYSVHVPAGDDEADPPGLTLNLHSLTMNHWQYNGSTGVQQLGEQRGHVVATPHARGADGWYQHEAEYDVFEVYNDLARHYALDPDRVTLAGYSMGGYATYRLGGRYPDLVGTAMTVVGPPGDGIWVPPAPPTGGAATLSNRWLENTRNVPFLNVVAGADELVPILGTTVHNLGVGALADGLLAEVDPALGGLDQLDAAADLQSFEGLGHRYRYRIYPAAEHLTLALLSYDLPGSAAYLGDGAVDRDPRRVTFAAVPAADDPDLGLVADGAYWVSDIVLADEVGEVPKGVVDAISHGVGEGAPEPVRHTDAGVGPVALPYTEVGLDWGEPPALDPDNRLEVGLTNIGGASIDLARASLDPGRRLTVEVEADAAGELSLAGTFPGGTEVRRDDEPLSDVVAGAAGVRLPVVVGTQTFVLGADDAPGGETDPDHDISDPGTTGPDDAARDDPSRDAGSRAVGAAGDRATPATGGGAVLWGAILLAAALLLARLRTGDAAVGVSRRGRPSRGPG